MLHLEGQNYVMRGESSGFSNRQKSIFDKLDAVIHSEKKTIDLERHVNKQADTDSEECMVVQEDTQPDKMRKIETKHFKGKESIFKRPESMQFHKTKQTIPDFRRNPHKWKKYSLCDVSQDDMSEKSNTAAAMSFLKEIRSRKSHEEPMEIGKKITFKRPKTAFSQSVVQTSNEESPGEDGTSYFKGSKLVMPEYVIGSKNNLKTKKRESKKDISSNLDKDKTNEVKLSHLSDFSDENEVQEEDN